MKRLLAILIFIIGISAPSESWASAIDEQWQAPQSSSMTFHKIVISPKQDFLRTFSHLFAESYPEGGKLKRFICTDIQTQNCKNPDYYSYVALLPVCSIQISINCIESLFSVDQQGKRFEGKFLRYSVEKQINNFAEDKDNKLPNNANSSYWEIPNSNPSSSNKFVLNLGIEGKSTPGNSNEDKSYRRIFSHLSPVTSVENGLMKLGGCVQDINAPLGSPSVIANTSCSGLASIKNNGTGDTCEYPDGDTGNCFAASPFDDLSLKYGVKIRLDFEPLGWIHGRLMSPNIEINSKNDLVEVTILASPIRVPIFLNAGDWEKLGAATKNWWLTVFPQCNQKSWECQKAGGKNPAQPWKDTESSFVGVDLTSYGDYSLQMISALAQDVSDKAIATPTIWSFESMDQSRLIGSNSCIVQGKGLKGIVTTNSTAYSAGPPTFEGNSLNYQVASMHYLADGTVFTGTYDLLMRSSVARCLYNFSSAPVEAKVEVLNQDGKPQIATTQVSEGKGWLAMSAYGFTFSAPTIRVKLLQSKDVAPVVNSTGKKSITCLKGKISKKVTGNNPKCPVGYKKK